METKFINDQDKEKYDKFFKHLLEGISLRRGFKPLHHYTSGERLIQIISSGEQWITQASCLNDSKELTHSVDLLKDAIFKKRKTEVGKEFEYLLTGIEKVLGEPDVEVAGAFIGCFSEREDDLSQWRAYGGISGGYSIEYDLEKLAKILEPNHDLISPVIYGGDDLNSILYDLIKWTEINFMQGLQDGRAPTMEEWAEEFGSYWLWHLSFLTPLFKHPAFKDEEEWRIIHWFTPDDVSSVRFIQSQSMLRRHLPLNLSKADDEGNSLLPIKSIMVGPTSHPKISKIGVGDLLLKHGYGDTVKVKITDIPFRTVT
jgi:hypothetical protein